jgi:L-serine dehydratase, iron-sulfur-dependent, beta subunit
MKNYGVFDILGPIMVGPSSSHTAGAARLGKIAKIISEEKICEVKFLLHGSFSKTYKGHGTDRALVAGILGMDPWDERLRDAIEIARDSGITIEFIEADLGEVHPNTVKFIITSCSGKVTEVLGSSIGGGSVVVNEIDGETIEFTGEYPTVIIKHMDVPGVVSQVSSIMYEEKVNIAFMKLFRNAKGETATMILETDSTISEYLEDKIRNIQDVYGVKVINSIKNS